MCYLFSYNLMKFFVFIFNNSIMRKFSENNTNKALSIWKKNRKHQTYIYMYASIFLTFTIRINFCFI